MKFYITNFPGFVKKSEGSYSTNLHNNTSGSEGVPLFYIDGYILPRMAIFEEYKEYSQEELLPILYKKHGEKFIDYIKGVFNIIIINGNSFQIYNDRHSIKRVFIYTEGYYFYISNNLQSIRDNFDFSMDPESVAIFCLFNHFVNGDTIFKRVRTSEAASKLDFSGKQLIISAYWKPHDLFRGKADSTPKDSAFTVFWDYLITNYIKYLKPGQVSITLTGGVDSRLVLAPLLHKQHRVHAFSYGDPNSFDAVLARQISERSKIPYENYYVSSASPEWLCDQADKLIRIGDTLINMHRAHRNDASEKEITLFPGTEMIFTGLMGGEYLKEPLFGNAALPELFTKFKKGKEGYFRNMLINMLEEKCINTKAIDIDCVYNRITSFLSRAYHPDPKKSKFLITYNYYGSIHHAQDSAIYNYHFRNVVNPFMDIDFLERISYSPDWYINNSNPFHKFFHSGVFIRATDQLAPVLSGVPYAKRGQYTANDFLNRPIMYLIKRFSYLFTRDKLKYPVNFAIGDWLYNFSKKQLETLHPDLENIIRNESLFEKLENIRSETTESRWYPVTNPINLSMYLKAYETN